MERISKGIQWPTELAKCDIPIFQIAPVIINSNETNISMIDKLYVFILRRAPHGEGGPIYGTKFDLSAACDVCGTDAKQIGPLLLNSSEIPKNKEIIETLDHELLTSLKIKELFETKNIKGMKFFSVLNYQNNQPLEYWQIEPQFTLPPLSEESRGIITERQCPKCKRDGFFDTVKEKQNYIYKSLNKSFLQQADIFNTWEHFGNSNLVEDPPLPPGTFGPRRVLHFAKPRLIVSEKIKQLFEDLKIRGANFEEVIVRNYI